MSDNYFARLNAINVSEHIEKKGGFSYLSWPFAVAQLRLADPAACWEVRRFNGLPYLFSEIGVFVEVAVTVQGVTLCADPSRARRTEPADPCAHGVRHQHARSSAAWSRPSRCTGSGCTSTPARTCRSRWPMRRTTLHRRRSSRAKVRCRCRVGQTISPAQQAHIQRLASEVGTDVTRVLDHFGVSSLKEIRIADYLRVVRSLEKRRAA